MVQMKPWMGHPPQEGGGGCARCICDHKGVEAGSHRLATHIHSPWVTAAGTALLAS